MKVIIWDLKDTGTSAVVLGDKAFVDVNYLEDFMKYHSDAKIEDTNAENASLAASIREGSSMKGPKNQSTIDQEK